MKKILCPTDFSPGSGKAIDYAIEVGKITGAEIVLFAAYEEDGLNPGVIRAAQPGIGSEITEKLEAAKSIVSENYAGGKVSVLARKGETVSSILDAAKELEADFIIMGTKGLTGYADLVFGTNTAGVIRKANIPVLCIPREAEFDGVLDRIIFATEVLEEAEAGYDQLVDFARKFDATIDILHVSEDSLEHNEADEKGILDIYVKNSGYDKLELNVREDKDTMEGIIYYFNENPADMVAVITQKRNILERIFDPSLTQKLAQMSTVPLLVFHE